MPGAINTDQILGTNFQPPQAGLSTDLIWGGTAAIGGTFPGNHEPSAAIVEQTPLYGGGIAAFKSRPVQVAPPRPNQGQPWLKKFIPPLALFNDASQWVNKKYFVQTMPRGQNPNSNPLLKAQAYSPPPINVQNVAAGRLNLQLQLGMLSNQAAQLTLDASNWYGG